MCLPHHPLSAYCSIKMRHHIPKVAKKRQGSYHMSGEGSQCGTDHLPYGEPIGLDSFIASTIGPVFMGCCLSAPASWWPLRRYFLKWIMPYLALLMPNQHYWEHHCMGYIMQSPGTYHILIQHFIGLIHLRRQKSPITCQSIIFMCKTSLSTCEAANCVLQRFSAGSTKMYSFISNFSFHCFHGHKTHSWNEQLHVLFMLPCFSLDMSFSVPVFIHHCLFSPRFLYCTIYFKFDVFESQHN